MHGLGVLGFRVQQLAADLAGGPQPLLPSAGLLIKSRVLDRNPVVGNPSQPDGLGIFDQCAEQGASPWELTYCADGLVVQTNMQEPFQQAIGANHS